MKSFLFLIMTDPRTSGRPAEAVRIAAGVGVWKKVEVTVYLRDAAVLLLSEETDGLVDGENCGRYLPILRESGRPVYVEKGAPLLSGGAPATVPVKEISDMELAALAAARDHVLRF